MDDLLAALKLANVSGGFWAGTSPEAPDTWDGTGLGNDLTSGTFAQADVAALIGIRSAA